MHPGIYFLKPRGTPFFFFFASLPRFGTVLLWATKYVDFSGELSSQTMFNNSKRRGHVVSVMAGVNVLGELSVRPVE